jgi:hypothetical protein
MNFYLGGIDYAENGGILFDSTDPLNLCRHLLVLVQQHIP